LAVDQIAVVARPAVELVRPRAAVDHVITGQAEQLVGAGIAGHRIAKLVAIAPDGGAAGQGEVFDIGSEPEARGRKDAVGTLARILYDRVAVAVGVVAVVAKAADHPVDTGAAVEDIIAGQAKQLVRP
jgi:hypothetical protein